MNYTGLVDEVVARIQALMPSPDYEVVRMPDAEADFARAVRSGRVHVSVGQTKDDGPTSTAHIRQLETINVDLIIHARFLHAPDPQNPGIYEIEELIRKYLVGWMPTHCNRMYKVSFAYSAKHDDRWEYILTLATTTLIVEETDAVNEVNITQITLNSAGNDTVVVPAL